MEPQISVIVPIYNVETYLDQCIKSIIGQSYENLEIILVDDGSLDKCPQMCDEYARKDNRIHVLHKTNGGLSDARNQGLQLATGEFVLFIDSDDYWISRDTVKTLVEVVHNFKNPDIIFFGRTTFIGEKLFTGPIIDINNINGRSAQDVLSYILTKGTFYSSAYQKLIRRSVLTDNNISFKKGLLSEDWDWTINLYQHARNFYAIKDNFYGYRKRQGSITETFSTKHATDILYVISKWSELLAETDETAPSKGFLAYCLCCTLGSIQLLPKSGRKIKDRFKPFLYLLQYDFHPKVKQTNRLIKLLGFNLTCQLLGLYLKYRPKRLK